MNRYAFIVPVYRHGSTLEYVVSSLQKYGFPVIVVDDGNDEADKKFIREVQKKYSNVVLVEHKKNKGKGKAVNDGVIRAAQLGMTHVFQLDSDGQHDLGAVDEFINLSEKNPSAIICGYPQYDDTVPRHRLNGRKIANFWIHVVTVSGKIKDAMIGFRIYPVAPYAGLLKRHAIIDSHMGYDIDILVHLSWKNIDVISSPVKISYPKDGVSNFRAVRDNIHISLTYARLCCGMIIRLPLLVLNALKGNRKK